MAPEPVPGTEAKEKSFPTGQVVPIVHCLNTVSETYALYLPAGYPGDRKWPVLLAMDPAGRALVPANLFRRAAEEYGYILASSYDTRSDGSREPNLRALKAMLPDLQKRFAVDSKRLYLAGFSGTARFAWDVGHLLPDQVAGLLGFGAGLPGEGSLPRGEPFVFFGGAGTTGFNYDEMQDLAATLQRRGFPHLIVSYEGGHAWPPEPICRAGLRWMELQAMRRGERAPDRTLIESAFRDRFSHAEALERQGHRLKANLAYQSIARDFDLLLPVAEAARRAAELESATDVRNALSKRRDRAA
ncbi:MAG: hypothetical protein ACE5ID_11855, partial [Acidobacteriota bacterium]